MSDAPTLMKTEHEELCSANQTQLEGRFTAINQQFHDGSDRMAKIEKSLDENTAATKEILDILNAAKGAFKFFGWVGSFIRWVSLLGAAIASFWYAIHIGPPQK